MSAVSLSEYADAWRREFDCAAADLSVALVGAAGLTIEHIGSTSVPGLCAKPVIDVLVGVTSLEIIQTRVASLRDLGFHYRPEHEAEIPDRRYFIREPGQHLRAHVHVVVHGGALWLNHITFRDALRRNAQLAAEYASLKRTLALKHAEDKAAYTRAKAPFIQHALRRRGEA